MKKSNEEGNLSITDCLWQSVPSVSELTAPPIFDLGSIWILKWRFWQKLSLAKTIPSALCSTLSALKITGLPRFAIARSQWRLLQGQRFIKCPSALYSELFFLNSCLLRAYSIQPSASTSCVHKNVYLSIIFSIEVCNRFFETMMNLTMTNLKRNNYNLLQQKNSWILLLHLWSYSLNLNSVAFGAENRLFVSKENFVDSENVVNVVWNTVFHDNIGFVTSRESISSFFQQFIRFF